MTEFNIEAWLVAMDKVAARDAKSSQRKPVQEQVDQQFDYDRARNDDWVS